MKYRRPSLRKITMFAAATLILLAVAARTPLGRYALSAILFASIKHDDRSVIVPLVCLGADANFHGDNDLTPLILLISDTCDGLPMRDKLDMANRLYRSGANVNAGGAFRNMPPLSAAALRNNIPFARWLIDHGADINACDTEVYDTSLKIAVEKKNLAMCKFLLAHGADPDIADAIGVTPLMSTQSLAVAALLIPAHGYSTDMEHSQALERALICHVRFGETEIVRQLLEAGVSANATNLYGNALIGAVQCGRSASVRLLLDYGADMSVRDKHGRTALGIARRDRNAKIIRILIDAGAAK